MATVNPVLVDQNPGVWERYKWEAMVTNDTIIALQINPLAAELNFHIFGTFANGTTVAIDGSNDDGTTFTALSDGSGSAVSKTAAAIVSIREQPLQVKPTVLSASSDDIDVWLLVRFLRT